MKQLITVTVLLLLAAVIHQGQTLSVSPYGVSPRDVTEDTLTSPKYFDRAYNGLQNVGKETKVYLKAYMDEGDLGTPAWNVITKPAGSNAAFGATMDVDASTQLISFIPDLVGTYVLEVSSSGQADTIVFNASTYLGAYNGAPSCASCHGAFSGSLVSNWEQTGHYDIFERGLNGTLSNHYNSGCVSCHTTGYDAEANNGGFDDFGFVFPDSLYEGQYDNMVAAYPDAMQRARIQCESCHGPGANHFSLKDNFKIQVTLASENCALCHDDGHYHVYPEQWDYSAHASGNTLYSGSNRASCTPCHNGKGFIDFAKGNPQNAPEEVPITCAACHDPHDATNVNQLRLVTATLQNGVEFNGGKGGLCVNCHKSRRDGIDYTDNYLDNISSHYGPHHGCQADVLVGTNVPTFGQTMPQSPHLQATTNGCVDCHMYVDESGHGAFAGAHSFSMVTPDGHDNVAACAPCHGDVGEHFGDKKMYINGNADLDGNGVAEGLPHEVHGLLNILAELLPPYGSTDINNIDSNWTVDEARGYYNYLIVEEDRSGGIHNPRFAVGLLYASIEALGGVVNVEPIEDNGMPTDYSISQNYPNPFNPTTNIKFSIPEAQSVKLIVYDAIGREVSVLVDETLNAGYYEKTWDAGNLSSGIYFYKIVAGNYVEAKKMLLLK